MTHSVLITGANRGLGLEFARQYLDEGWRVYAACRSPESAAELSRMASASDGRMSLHPLDVRSSAQIEALRVAIDGPLDVLINNAGIYGQQGASFGNTDPEKWLTTFEVNTIAPLKVCETLKDRLVAGDQKTIATLTSLMGSMEDNGSGGSYVYRSSKAALNAVMKSAAVDLRVDGIKIAILHPGWVRTDMGGPNALISTQESVTGMRKVIAELTQEQSGSFLNYDGSTLPW